MAIFTADLRHRRVDFHMPSDPLTNTTWILRLQRIYAHPTATPGGRRANRKSAMERLCCSRDQTTL
ncbi:MAG TPA: hypothetical protein VFF64_15625 [Candidatus Eremiobacteraceae bacterium]|nr:hypothetical protein [Candidatus Eremiobacteraceae bacterium]